MDAVDKTLKLWRTAPFTWGGIIPHVPGYGDCVLSLAEYIADNGGPDIATRYRGTYDGREGAGAIIEAAGGIVALVEQAGLSEASEPARGDIAIIEPGIGALCTGRGFAARLEHGVMEIDRRFVKVIKAWVFVGSPKTT